MHLLKMLMVELLLVRLLELSLRHRRREWLLLLAVLLQGVLAMRGGKLSRRFWLHLRDLHRQHLVQLHCGVVHGGGRGRLVVSVGGAAADAHRTELRVELGLKTSLQVIDLRRWRWWRLWCLWRWWRLWRWCCRCHRWRWGLRGRRRHRRCRRSWRRGMQVQDRLQASFKRGLFGSLSCLLLQLSQVPLRP